MLYYLSILKDRCFKKNKIDDKLKKLIYDLIDLQNELIEYIECEKVVKVNLEK
jgi:hypothetical protein